MSTNEGDREDEATEVGGGGGGDDEDTGAPIAPIVTLSEVSVTTGEEDEHVLLDLKAKLYRFDKDGNQWKERGAGNMKLLKHKETSKGSCANKLVVPSIKVQEHAGNDKSCVWHASDFGDWEMKEELFCIRFGSIESSGYESEDRSVNEVGEDEDPSGWSNDEDGEISELDRERTKFNQLDTGVEDIKDKARTKDVAIDMDDPIQVDISNYILKQKSVFRCKLCPRIVCLSEDTMRTHLKSKRHIRSKKLLGEGRLKLMLNSDGEVEEDQETHAERHARIVALAQEVQASKKKDSGRQRQNCRRKKRQQRQSDKRKMEQSKEQSKEKTTKKKRKTEN